VGRKELAVRHFVIAGILLVFVAFGMVNVVSAASSGPPVSDTFIRITAGNTNFDGLGLSVAASTSNCNPTDTIYLQWDLADIPSGSTVYTTSLTLTANYVSSTSGATLGLYRASDNYTESPALWTESGLTANNAPAPNALIETQSAPTMSGQTVVFDSAALASYVNAEAAGDKMVSFAVRFSQGCNTLDLVRFDDHENGASGPDLQLQDPNAVRIQSFQSLRADIGMGATLVVVSVLIVALTHSRQNSKLRGKR
jgi:hypothetical protein